MSDLQQMEQQIKHEPHPIFDNSKMLGKYDVVKVETLKQLQEVVKWLNSELGGEWSCPESAFTSGGKYFNFFLENGGYYRNSWVFEDYLLESIPNARIIPYEDLLLDQSKADHLFSNAVASTPDDLTAELPKEEQAKSKDQSPLEIQINGDHYKKLPIQPVEYTMKNNLNFLQGSVIKYITRYKNKGGLVDLQKARHCIDMLIQLEYLEC